MKKDKYINCKSCGKKILKISRKCLAGTNYCCDCQNERFGCYSNQLFRHDIGCKLDQRLNLLTLEELEQKKHMEESWGFTIDKIKREWRCLVTVALFKKERKNNYDFDSIADS